MKFKSRISLRCVPITKAHTDASFQIVVLLCLNRTSVNIKVFGFESVARDSKAF